jgi:hypothetical protein
MENAIKKRKEERKKKEFFKIKNDNFIIIKVKKRRL